MITHCEMSDIKHKDNRFSWSRQRITTHTCSRIKETIQCCLDLAMANSAWLAMFPASETLFLESIASDHIPIILKIEKQTSIHRGQFRFDNRLIHDNRMEDVIKAGWNKSRGLNLADNISQCRKHIARWKKMHRNHSGEQMEYLKSLLKAEFLRSSSMRVLFGLGDLVKASLLGVWLWRRWWIQAEDVREPTVTFLSRLGLFGGQDSGGGCSGLGFGVRNGFFLLQNQRTTPSTSTLFLKPMALASFGPKGYCVWLSFAYFSCSLYSEKL